MFVSNDAGGLLTVMITKNIAVEMTLDRAIRIVNHEDHSVAAVNRIGDMACIHHNGAKIYHDGTVIVLYLQPFHSVKHTCMPSHPSLHKISS